MYSSYLIITDSGGIQEEAPSLGTPVLITRNTTERPEIIECGGGILVGTDLNNITKRVNSLIADKDLYEQYLIDSNPFGSGNASEYIVKILEKHEF